MSESIVDKILTVVSIATITELATGDLINQVSFGYFTENTPAILSRIPVAARENFPGNQIGIAEFILFIKTPEVMYKVGSKWHLKIDKDGSMNLAAVE